MSTTTVGDLLDRAEALASSLRATGPETTTGQWRSFDSTTYRLLHELVGPERTGIRTEILNHATVTQVINGYPSPMATPGSETTYNALQAANHLGVSHWRIVADIRRQRLPATFDGSRYSINATDLSPVPQVQPADPASTHPLDRLSCTLGVLADLVLTAASDDDDGVTFGDDVKSPRVHVRAGLGVVMLSRSSSCCRGLAGMAAPPLCALSRCVPVREAGRGRSLR